MLEEIEHALGSTAFTKLEVVGGSRVYLGAILVRTLASRSLPVDTSTHCSSLSGPE